MSEQDGSPSEPPDGDRPTGAADAPVPAAPTAPAASTADGTGPIERSSGGRMFAGRYQLLARRGTATDVALFEAVDTVTERSVAVKIVHPDICAGEGFAERFADVMGRVARTRHPNLTEIIDIGTSTWGGRPVHFLVCENLTGGSLRDLRDRGRQLSPSQVVMIGLDACRGLDVAHRAGFVHGDIRPANLVFGADGRLRLADVGLAALVSDAWWVEPTGVDIEQAKFASPEQAQGLEPTTKSDVYALCLCLLEAVTGQLPFVGDSSVATLSNRVDKLLPVSADLGPLAAVLERAGRPDQDDRSSASEFGRALHQAAEKLPRPAPLALVTGGLFAAAPGDPTSPSGMIRRPVEASTVDPDLPIAAAAATDAAATADAADTEAPAAADVVASDAEVADVSGQDVAADAPGDGGTAAEGAASDEDGTAATTKPWLPEPTRATPIVAGSTPAAAGVVEPDPTAVVPATPVAPAVAGPEPAAPASVPAVATAPVAAAAAGEVPPPPAPVDQPSLVRDPRSRRTLVVVLAVLLVALAAGGVVAWWTMRTESNEVPDLTQLEVGEALNMVSEFGWNVVTTEAADDVVPVGVVIATDPVAGSVLDEGADLTLVVSTGPAPRVLPEIVGLGVEQATADLLELGLVLEVGERAFSDDVPVDEVISWTVPDQPALQAGDTVLPGTSIVVVVSGGPAPRVVPELTSLPVADATAAIEALDLLVVVGPEEFSNDVAVGSVVAQDPAAGTELPPGGTVTIAVSKGPDLVPVPPLAGLTVQQATDALAAAGLVIGQVSGDPAGVNVLAEVGGVSIGGGATFPRGTAIDLTFEVPAPPETPPA